jgi:hypothetical protein
MTIDLNAVVTNDGWDALVKFFTGIIDDGSVIYFKLGEGRWSESDPWVNQVATGDGTTTYSGDLSFLPVVLSSFTLTAGAQSVTDTPNVPYDGTGTLSGNGTGTLNYKTGEWAVVWSAAVGGGVPISASYRYRGIKSAVKTHEIGAGNATSGPYFTILPFKAPDAPVAQGTVTISDGHLTTPQTLTDVPNSPYDGEGTLVGDGSGVIDYTNGETSFIFTSAVPASQTMGATYQYDGAPDAPLVAYTDLQSEADPNLYTFEKQLTSADKWVVENAFGKLRVKVFLETHEGIDDGHGWPPYFFEGGLFLEDDTMLAYFTFTKSRKLGSTEILFYFDQVL